MKSMDDRNIYIYTQIFVIEIRAKRKEIGISFIYIAISIADSPLVTSDLVLVVCQCTSGMRYPMLNIYQCHASVRFD